MIIVAPGSLSEGFTTSVLPVTVANAADQSTILLHMSGRLRRMRRNEHGGEVERRNGSTDTEWYPTGVRVHVICDLKLVTKEC